MTEDFWAESNTSPEAIAGALRGLLHARHTTSQSLAPARVLNLVVVVDRDWKGEVANRLARVGRYQASRTILCAVEEGRTTLDGRAVMSYEERGEGPGIVVEQVEVDIGTEHLAALESVVDPLVISEIATMLWSPHGHDEAVQTLLGLTDVLLLDSDQVVETEDALAKADEVLRSAYVVDLAWLRTTPWRERLAASFDPPSRLPLLARLSDVRVRHQETSSASALLLAGWLGSRLGWQSSSLGHDAREGWVRGQASRDGANISVELERADQEAPGLAGVTVTCGDQYSLSLDRGRGGLIAQERMGSDELRWQVLGASRGEGGILGEGVRQALLRDPTYGPALAAARGFAGA